MPVITINATNYQVYQDVANTNKYWQAMVGQYANAWNLAANAAKQPMACVQATRLLDRVLWQGLPVGVPVVDTVLQWPRTGVVDALGNAVSSLSVPNQIVVANMELSAAILLDDSIFTTEMSGSNVKKADAGGGVGVEFFVPTLGITGRFPQQIQELIGQFLRGAAGGAQSGSFSSGTDGTETSAFGTTVGDNGFDLDRGL